MLLTQLQQDTKGNLMDMLIFLLFGIVVKRGVLVFIILFCIVVVVHLLFSKVVAHLSTLSL